MGAGNGRTFTNKEQQELQQFVVNETQKLRINQEIHMMTDICWKKCFGSSSMKGSGLTSSEETCTRDCVNRFLDGNDAIIRQLQRCQSEGRLH